MFFSSSVVLVMLAVLTLPIISPRLDEDADGSLSAVLGYAHQAGWQYGTDLVFTYGPLGFLTIYYYASHNIGARMLVDVALGLVVASGLCFLAGRLRPGWQWLLVGLFIWAGANAIPRSDLILNTGLFCWGLLCFMESGKRLSVAVAIFTALAVFAGLAKLSFLFTGLVSVAALSADLLTRGHKKLSAGLVLGSLGGFALGWVIAGQQVRHLGPYLRNALAIVQSFNEAQGWEGAEFLRGRGFGWVFLATPLVLLGTLTAFDQGTRFLIGRRLCLAVWGSFFMFTIWKHGFVRLDRHHVVMALAFTPVACFGMCSLHRQPGVARWLPRTFATALCLLSLITLHEFFFQGWWPSIKQPLASITQNLGCLLKPRAYKQRMDGLLDVNRRAAQLPRCREIIGKSSVDVFGQHAGYAVFNELNYDPRPVFQSFYAANAQLMSLNEQFYLSPRTPEFVLFNLSPLDAKMPALEDALVLRHLLCHDLPVAAEGPFLLLQRRNSDAARLTLLGSGKVRPRERIDLAEHGEANLWLEIDLQSSLIGSLRQWAYRPPPVRLAAWREGRLLIQKRAPPSMLRAGFLASPLLVGNQDVANLYAGQKGGRPTTYSIELPRGEEYLWRSQASYRLYRIENPLGPGESSRSN